jgi:hypothetical protein
MTKSQTEPNYPAGRPPEGHACPTFAALQGRSADHEIAKVNSKDGRVWTLQVFRNEPPPYILFIVFCPFCGARLD